MIKRISINPVMAAMALARSRENLLARTCGEEIVEGYKSGDTIEKLARKYSPDYNISQRVASASVYNFLVHRLSKEELRKIGKEHMKATAENNGSLGGTYSRKHNLGCFNTKKYDVKKARQTGGENGGKAAGIKNFEQKIGMWALTEQEWKEARKKMIRTRGQIPYEGSKRFTEYGLLNEKEYIFSLKEEGLSWPEIEDETNTIFNHNRRYATMRTIYNLEWKNN